MAYDNVSPRNAVRSLSSAWAFSAVTPSDSTDFDTLCRAIYVGGGGNVAAVGHDGTAVTFTGVTTGTVLPIACRRINSTNTTATSIVALF